MLFGSTMLEIAISLFFIYLLLSLICSAINEWLAGILALRANTLREGIENLFNDPDSKALAGAFYNHPLIKGLARGQGEQSLPSYIPSRTFVRVLLDVTAPEDVGSTPRTLVDLYTQLRDRAANISTEPDRLDTALLMLFDEVGINPDKIERVTTTLQALEAARAKLRTFIEEADGDTEQAAYKLVLDKITELEQLLIQREAEVKSALDSAQQNIENYFNDAMGRVSGWYKRRTQAIIIVLAILISTLLNVDSVAITTSLISNNALRATIVSAAEATVKSSDDTLEQSLQEVLETKDELEALGLPIGWQVEALPNEGEPWMPFLLVKVLGLLITAIAVSLGAPFWFDLLNKLVNLRMTGQKPS